MSKSSSEKSISYSKAGRLKEAQTTLQLGKKFGSVTKGQDQEVIQRLILMEEKDKERVGKRRGRDV